MKVLSLFDGISCGRVALERADKYSQCLQEIKEIAEQLKSPHCTECSQVLNKKGKCTGDCGNDYRKMILDKISECIGVEE